MDSIKQPPGFYPERPNHVKRLLLSFAHPVTIRSRLLLGFVLIALVSALSVTVGALSVGALNGRRQAVDQLESVNALKSQEIRAWAANLQNELSGLLNEETAYERATIVLKFAERNKYYNYYSEAMRGRLQRVVNGSPQLRLIFLLDLHNKVILSTDPGQEGQVVLGDQSPIAALNSPFLLMVTGNPLTRPGVVMLLPVHDAGGKLLGALAGETGLSPIAAILGERTGLGETGKAYLLGAGQAPITQEYLASQGSPGEIRQSAMVTAETLLAAERTHSNGTASYLDYLGRPVLGVYRWQPELGMLLLTEQDQAEVFRVILTTLMVNAGIALLTVLFAVAAAWLVARGISRPLANLVDVASRIASGDLERTARVESGDELGILAAAFNSMTTQLRDLISSLEARVQRRTAELQAAFQALERKALQLETSAQVSRVATSILDQTVLLGRLADLIRDGFGYYHVLIFLVDADTQTLVLGANSGTQQHTIQTIPIGPGSLNGEAVKTNTAICVNDISTDPRYLPDPDLPDTRSELVIPLRVGDEIIGTLDVDSDQLEGFTPEDVLVIQGLGDQIAIAIVNARLYAQSQQLAVLEERNRLARELHDSVTQSLYSLRLLAEGWRRQTNAQNDPQVEEYLRQIGVVTDQSLREMRLLIYELRPLALEKEGLIGALHQRLESVEKRVGLDARLVADDLVDLSAPVEAGLYWIAQEALNNTLKHASAKSVRVHLTCQPEEIMLEVVDDGCGFSAENAAQASGMGISNMRERARKLGGQFDIETSPGNGARVRVTLPIQPPYQISPGYPAQGRR